MSNDSIEARLITLAAARFSRQALDLDPEGDFFEQLGIDSFKAMELLSALEKEFSVEIPDYELQGITTLKGLAQLIRSRQ
ncbi:MAG: acyl carrier protein [Myxococcales bacterium]|nr:acyl carrier protein [Myxococcales bacterium]MCB9708178.1 acyl carrier protein [Myxococcales bacterium]